MALIACRLLGAALFIALAVFSVFLARQDAATVDVQLIAARIELGDAVSLAALRSVTSVEAQPSSCRSYLQRAAITVHLAYLELQDQNADYDAWSDAAAGAQAAAEQALRCMPAEGNAWIRYAMVEHAISERPGPLADLVRMSGTTAPADVSPLMARLSFYEASSDQTRGLLGAQMEHDLTTYLAKARTPEIRRFLDPVPPALAPMVRAVISTLNAERREEATTALPSLR